MSMFTPRGAGARPVRRRAGATLRALVVAVALALIVAGAWSGWRATSEAASDARAEPTPSCPEPSPAPVMVPAPEVTVNVFNATQRRGLATRVAKELQRRGFRVGKVDNDPLERKVTGAAEVRHSAAGVDAARTVSAQVGPVVAVPDQRPGPSVDLALGAGFSRLVAPEQAAAALAPAPEPVPAGC